MARVIDVQTAHTSSLDPSTLEEVRALVHQAFDGHFDDDDWDHCLGGVHAVVWEDDQLVAHGSIIQRRLLHGDRALRTGYVEGVAVRADRRRRGYGRAVMQQLDGVLHGAYEIGALSSGPEAARLYRTLGWRRWEGRTWVLAPTGIERTAEEDETTYVLPVAIALDLGGDLVCDWRDGDVW